MDISVLIEKLQDKHCDWVKENIPRHLTTIRQRVVTFIRGTTHHKRTAASHVHVFIISPEEYGLHCTGSAYSFRFLKGLTDAKYPRVFGTVVPNILRVFGTPPLLPPGSLSWPVELHYIAQTHYFTTWCVIRLCNMSVQHRSRGS